MRKLLVLIPVFDDWAALGELLPRLATMAEAESLDVEILVVDDGSIQPAPEDLLAAHPALAGRVQLLTLRRNLGHQRAIAVGLSHMHAESDVETVVIMDGDGEDDPLDVPRLLAEYDRHDGRSVVFAARRRRLTSLGFSLGYHLYRFVHRVLTGRTVRVGNFSVLPRDALDRLVVMPELWSHYAASVYVSRFPHLAVPADRAARLEGGSRMSYHDWVLHGLSALSVYSEAIGTRVIAATAAPLGLALVATLAALAYWFVGGAAGPLTLLIFTSAVLLQLLVTALAFTFLVLTGRRRGSSLPVRDHVHFVQACRPYPSRESR